MKVGPCKASEGTFFLSMFYLYYSYDDILSCCHFSIINSCFYLVVTLKCRYSAEKPIPSLIPLVSLIQAGNFYHSYFKVV